MFKKGKASFWVITNQEEVPVAMSYAKTAGGALARFETESGKKRLGFRAARAEFKNNCTLL